jgi:hypothetical protein
MIGDFFGGGLVSILVVSQGGNEVIGAAPLPGANVPRFKMAENTSPLPQDRIYFDYSLYGSVPIGAPTVNVNAFTLGFEKAFFDGAMSFEMRLPMASTIGNDVVVGEPSPLQGEVGNLGMALKGLLMLRERFALSAGLALTAPTAEDMRYFFTPRANSPDLIIESDSVHLLPFVGGVWTPGDRLFAIGYFQIDVDANGAPVLANNGTGGLTPQGRFREPTVMYADLTLGYWARRPDHSRRFIRGLAYVVELHMNQGLDSTSLTRDFRGRATTFATPSLSVLDLTAGAHIALFRNTTLTAAYSTPLTQERQFDGQLRILLNRYF